MLASPQGESNAALPGVSAGPDGGTWRAGLGSRPRSDTSNLDGAEACPERSATSPPPRSLPRIAVVVRKRPLSEAEKKRNEADLVKTRGRNAVLVDEPREKVDLTPYVMRHEFRVDYAFDENSTNAEVYKAVIRPLVESCCFGDANTSCFAYGQTGSGKTYTMLGPQPYGRGVEAGVFELAAEDIFKCLESTEKDAFVSFFEIYNGKLFDLLQNRKLVAALENGKKEVVVRDLRVEQVRDKEVLLSKMIEGVELRKIGANSVNDESSRSHAILQVFFKKRNSGDTCGRIAFIDLAGSERGADTLQHSRQTQQDGAGINRSLLALKECIRAMDQYKGHIPFRDSELTKVLREIFVGRSSRSVMIATVSPSTSCCEQTLNTLRYASRVKNFRHVPPCATTVVPASVASLPSRPSSSAVESAPLSLGVSRSISSANVASRQTRATLPCMQTPPTDGVGTFPEAPARSPFDAEMHLDPERWQGAAPGVSPTPQPVETAPSLSPLVGSCASPSRAPLRNERFVTGKSARGKCESKGAVARAGSVGIRRDTRLSLPGRTRMTLPRPEVVAPTSLEAKQSREEDDSAGSGGAQEETDPETQLKGVSSHAAPGTQRDRSTFSASTCAPSSCERLSSCGSSQTLAPAQSAKVRGRLVDPSHASPRERGAGEQSSGCEDEEATAGSTPSPLLRGAKPGEERDRKHRGAAGLGARVVSSRPMNHSGATRSAGPGARLHASSGSSEDLRNSQDMDFEVDGDTETLNAISASRPISTRKLVAGSRVGPGDKSSLLPRFRAARGSCSSSPFAPHGSNGAGASVLVASQPVNLPPPDSTSVTSAVAATAVDSVETLGFGVGTTGKTTRGRGGEAFEISLGTTGAARKKGEIRSTLPRTNENLNDTTHRGDSDERLSVTRLYKTTRLFGPKLTRERGKNAAAAVVEPHVAGAPRSLQSREENRSVESERTDPSTGEKDATLRRKENGRIGVSTPQPSHLRTAWLRAHQEQRAQQGALVCPDGSSIIFVPRNGRPRDASTFSSVTAKGNQDEAENAAHQAGVAEKRSSVPFSLSCSSHLEEDAEMTEDSGSGLSKKRREDELDAYDSRRDRRGDLVEPTPRLSAVSPFITRSNRDTRPASAAIPTRGIAFPSKLPRPSPVSQAGLSLSCGGDSSLGGDSRIEKTKNPVVVSLDDSSQRLLAHLLPRAGFRGASLSFSLRGSATEEQPSSPLRRKRGDAVEEQSENEKKGAQSESPSTEGQETLAKRVKGEDVQDGQVDVDFSHVCGRDERMQFGSREPQAILRDVFSCTADYHNLDLAELDRLQGTVSDRRATCMQQLLQLAKKRAEDASSRHGINESQQDILVCRLHQANPGSSEFGEYMRQRMEADFRKLLAMRQLWVEAEEMRMLHRLLTTEYQTKSGAEGDIRTHRYPGLSGVLPSSQSGPGLGEEDDVSSPYSKKADVEPARDVEMTEVFSSPPVLSGCSSVVDTSISSQLRSPRVSCAREADACAFVDC